MSPASGERLPLVTLSTPSGEQFPLSRLQGRLVVGLLLAGDGSEEAWLRSVMTVEPELRLWGAELALIVAAPAEAAELVRERLTFHGLALLDAEGDFHRRLGAAAPNGAPRPALLIIDRVGELRYRLDLPSAAEQLTAAVDWARYLGIQEPECGTCIIDERFGEPD